MRLSHPGKMSVDPASGAFRYQVEDLSIPVRGGRRLTITRYYNSDSEHGINGFLAGWTFNHDERLRFEYSGNTSTLAIPATADVVNYSPGGANAATLTAVSVIFPNWTSERFTLQNGAFTAVDPWSNHTLAQNHDGTFTFTIPGQESHNFRADGKLAATVDSFGNAISYQWTPSGFLSAIFDPAGRKVNATGFDQWSLTNPVPFTATITDWSGRQVTYQYSAPSQLPASIGLSSVTDVDGHTTNYTYGYGSDNDPALPSVTAPIAGPVPYMQPLLGLSKIDFPNGTFVTNFAAGPRPMWKRVGLHVQGGRLAIQHVYDTNNQTVTKYSGDTGAALVRNFDSNMHLVGSTDRLGGKFEYAYDPSGRLTANTDPRLGTRSYQWDGMWNRTSQTDTLGNTTTLQYHPIFARRPTAVFRPRPGGQLAHSTMTYDPVSGRPLGGTDALNQTSSVGYDSYGHMNKLTRKGGGTTLLTYDPVHGLPISRTDPLGNTTTTTYDAVGRKLSETTPEGRTTSYTYTPSGLLTSVTDPTGATVTFEYDGNRNMIAKTDALGNVYRYTYNVLNEKTSMTDPLGNVTTWTYTPRGKVATVTDPLGNTTSFQYDENGRVVQRKDAANNITTTAYDPYCGTATTTDPLGRQTVISRDLMCRVTQSVAPDGATTATTYNVDGTVESVTDPRGNVTTYSYDLLGRRISQTDALGRTTRWNYDANNNVLSVTDPRGNVTANTYDANDRLIKVTRPDGTTVSYTYDRDGNMLTRTDARGKVWTNTYDLAGRLVKTTNPLGFSRQTVYDAMGRTVQTISPLGNTTTTAYDAAGRMVSVTDPMGNVIQRAYDAAGNLISITDPLGRVTNFSYDVLNRKIRTTDPLGGQVNLTLDAVGRVLTMTDQNGNPMQYQYDTRDRVTAEIYADGSQVSSSYDLNGNLIKKTDPRGFVTTYTYDAANQLTGVTYPDNAAVALSYDAAGNLTQRMDGTGTYGFTYDSNNRVTQFVEQDGNPYQLTYATDGNMTKLVFPDGRIETLTYDDAGRVSTLAAQDGLSTTFTYDHDDRRTGTDYPNGTSSTAQYDNAARLIRLVHQNAAQANITPDFRMTYDPAGNLTKLNNGPLPMWVYGYDALNRLTSAFDERAGGAASTYAYDPAGNRTSLKVNGVTTTSTYNNLNQLTQMGTTVFHFDLAGNLAYKSDPVDGTTTYRFDSRNRLVQVTLPNAQTVSYTYDEQGRMSTRTDATGVTSFEWNGWNLEREIAPGGQVTRYFMQGSEITAMSKDDALYRLHADWLGSVRAVTDSNGNTLASFDYDPWGNLLTASYDNIPGGDVMRFIGSGGVRFDVSTGLHYMRHRWYDSVLQRFTARDSLATTNLYLYANNAPTLMTDPSGLATVRNPFSGDGVTATANINVINRGGKNTPYYIIQVELILNWTTGTFETSSLGHFWWGTANDTPPGDPDSKNTNLAQFFMPMPRGQAPNGSTRYYNEANAADKCPASVIGYAEMRINAQGPAYPWKKIVFSQTL